MATRTATRKLQAAPKGLRRTTSRVLPLRVTPETLAQLQAVAAARQVSVSEVVRALIALGVGDPGGTGRVIAGMVVEDLGGPRIEIERVLVPSAAELESVGQLRLIGS